MAATPDHQVRNFPSDGRIPTLRCRPQRAIFETLREPCR